MPSLIAVSRSRFQNHLWHTPPDCRFAAGAAVTPLVAAEFARACLCMPIVFVEQAGRYQAVGLLSPLPGRNLYVGPKGEWLGTYMPASLRAYPFMLVQSPESDELVLCIDEESGLVTAAEGHQGNRFFEDDGNPSERTQAMFDFLRAVERDRLATQRAVDALAEAGVIQPWPFQILVEGVETPVTGLHCINESLLANIDDEKFLPLRRAGSLPLAYLQLLSMTQVVQFGHLARIQVPVVKVHDKPTAQSMEELFAIIDPEGKLFG